MQAIQTPAMISNSQFGLNLFRGILAEKRLANIVISPLSLAMALQMVSNGAVGETLTEMLSALKLAGSTLAEVNDANAQLMKTLATRSSELTINIANAIFTHKNLTLSSDMQAAMQRDYKAKVEAVEFGQPSALAAINGFVSAETRGAIPNMLQETKEFMRMVLVNAVYFNGLWAEPFSKGDTVDDVFHGASGDVRVPMMNKQDRLFHFKDETIETVALPYAEGRAQMIIFLPAQGKFEQWQNQLNFDRVFRVLQSMRSAPGSIRVPRFKVEWSDDLAECIAALGAKLAFDPLRADFSKLAQSAEPLYISAVIHKTFLDFNEAGTEAAAATAVIAAPGCAPAPPQQPFEMVVNRPFFIALQDLQSGGFLFFGQITNPA